jgi:hypothetical protein
LGDGGALADGAAERGGNRSIGANFETLGLVRRLGMEWLNRRAGAGFSRNCAAGWKWGCAVMRKLVPLIYGVVKSEVPFNPTLAMPRVDFQDGN